MHRLTVAPSVQSTQILHKVVRRSVLGILTIVLGRYIRCHYSGAWTLAVWIRTCPTPPNVTSARDALHASD